MIRPEKKSTGAALLATMALGLVLFLLGWAFLVHLEVDFQAHRQRQWAVQAEWNARAAMEFFLATRELPPRDPSSGRRIYYMDQDSAVESQTELENKSMSFCLVDRIDNGWRFEGVHRGVRRSLYLLSDGQGTVLKGLP